jgi:hypothetical protein
MAHINTVAQRCVGEVADHADQAEEITKRSRFRAGRAEITRPLRQRTVPNNGVVPQQAAAALRLLIHQAAAFPSSPGLAGQDDGQIAA